MANENIKILVVEDEALYANSLEILIDELGYELVAVVTNAEHALQKIKEASPDLLLVDINLAGPMNGIEMVQIAQHLQVTPAIFITSYTDQATFEKAKQLNPFAFITKPFDQQQLQRAIELAVMHIAQDEQYEEQKEHTWNDFPFKEHLFIKVRSQIVKVRLDNIDYMEVEDRYCTIVSGDQKYVARVGLNEMEEKIAGNQFYRIHRKYLVNLEKVTSIDIAMNTILLDTIELPISRNSKDELLKRLHWLS